MDPRSSPEGTALPANDTDDSELVDRLRVAVIGKRSTRNMEHARIAFDTNVDFARRARLLATMAGEQPQQKSKTNWRKSMGWLPIPMGILAVMVLGSMLASRTAAKHPEGKASQEKVTSQKKLETSESEAKKRRAQPETGRPKTTQP